MNQHPRSFTADETAAPYAQAEPETPVALVCGHTIDLNEALDLNPGEAVWCPGCQADQPVAGVEFLELHDAEQVLIDRAVYVEGVQQALLDEKDREWVAPAAAAPAPVEESHWPTRKIIEAAQERARAAEAAVPPTFDLDTVEDRLPVLAETGRAFYQDGFGPIHVDGTSEVTRFSGGSYTLTITLPDSGRSASVDVYGPRTSRGSVTEPEVNWSAIGSKSPLDAATYAALLAAAARLAPSAPGPSSEES